MSKGPRRSDRVLKECPECGKPKFFTRNRASDKTRVRRARPYACMSCDYVLSTDLDRRLFENKRGKVEGKKGHR